MQVSATIKVYISIITKLSVIYFSILSLRNFERKMFCIITRRTYFKIDFINTNINESYSTNKKANGIEQVD